MKSIRSIVLFIAATTALLLGSMANAEVTQKNPEHKFELAKQYYGQCQGVSEADFEKIRPHLKAFTDVAVMAETMADPAKFAKLVEVVNDPRTLHVMMKCSTEPVMWETWMRGLSNPVQMMNAGFRFMDPNVYMKWMMAPMNPAMYAPMFTMMNPAYYTRWMTAAMNPTVYQPFFAFADPNWYLPRMQWMMSPASYQPMMDMAGMFAAPSTAQTKADQK